MQSVGSVRNPNSNRLQGDEKAAFLKSNNLVEIHGSDTVRLFSIYEECRIKTYGNILCRPYYSTGGFGFFLLKNAADALKFVAEDIRASGEDVGLMIFDALRPDELNKDIIFG